MMSQTIEVPYAEYADLQVVSLPYRHDTGRQNSEISMVILLPRAHDGLDKVSAQLVQGNWRSGSMGSSSEMSKWSCRVLRSSHFITYVNLSLNWG